MANEIAPVDVPNHRVGPTVLRKGWIKTSVFSPTQAPITDSQFEFPTYPTRNSVGPVALRRKHIQPNFIQTSPLQYTVVSDAGIFVLSGQDVNLLKKLEVAADSGTFTLSGQMVDLLFGRLVGVNSGTFNLSGQVVEFLRGLVCQLEVSVFSLTGQVVVFTYTVRPSDIIIEIQLEDSDSVALIQVDVVVIQLVMSLDAPFVCQMQDTHITVSLEDIQPFSVTWN